MSRADRDPMISVGSDSKLVPMYIGDRDPTMIGAAWLLEQDGYERSQLSLPLGEVS